MPRDTDWVNAKTGETGQAFLVIKGKKYPRGMDFMTMFATGWHDLATWRDEKGRGLTGTEWRVFASLMSRLDFENIIEVAQARLAETLGIAQPNVSQAMGRLAAAGFIVTEPDEKDRRRTRYWLNPALGWRGTAGGWQQAIRARGNAAPSRTSAEDIDAFLEEHGIGSSAKASEDDQMDGETGDRPASPAGVKSETR